MSVIRFLNPVSRTTQNRACCLPITEPKTRNLSCPRTFSFGSSRISPPPTAFALPLWHSRRGGPAQHMVYLVNETQRELFESSLARQAVELQEVAHGECVHKYLFGFPQKVRPVLSANPSMISLSRDRRVFSIICYINPTLLIMIAKVADFTKGKSKKPASQTRSSPAPRS